MVEVLVVMVVVVVIGDGWWWDLYTVQPLQVRVMLSKG